MKRNYHYHRENCDNKLRAVITDQFGRTVSLFGKHAFEYSIVIESDEKIIKLSFKDGKSARQTFNKYKRKK